MLRRIFKSGSLKGTIIFAAGGVGFALANIVLAAVLPPAQFGLLSLFLALLQFGLACGPLGLDVVVKRHRPRVTLKLARRAATSAAIVAAAIAVGAKYFYGLSTVSALLLFFGGALGAGHFIIVGVYQSRAELGWALTLENAPNYVLLLLAILASLTSLQSATPMMLGVVIGYLLSNLLGWSRATRSQSGLAQLDGAVALREGLSSVSISLSRQLLWQLERFAIPKLISVNDLATYAVLAAVVGAPFRVTQLGVAFTLIEKLRSAPDAAAARAVLRHELLVGLLLVVGSVVGVLLLAPLVFHFVLHDKYAISPGLMAATLAVGVARVAEGFSTTVVTALGSASKLARISALGWISLVVAIAGAILGSRFGLAGILCGTCTGWLTLCAGGCVIGANSFRRRFADPLRALPLALPED
jgi:O-antigen/teichoic acid export membrane protein